MELEKVRELIEMMKANDLSELEIIDGQTRIMLKRGPHQVISPHIVAMPQAMAPVAPGIVTPKAGPTPPSDKPAETTGEEHQLNIVSPIVGTFFAAPSPEADPFVQIGSRVEDDTVVCIIEAMKVMNEIKSEVSGTIKKVLVENGSAVEFAQPLFLVEPD